MVLTDEVFAPLEDDSADFNVDDYIGNNDDPHRSVERGDSEWIPL